MEKKKFAIIAFDLDDRTFIVYIAFFARFDLGLEIFSFCKAKIISLKANETLISVFFKYTNFMDIFFKNLITKF